MPPPPAAGAAAEGSESVQVVSEFFLGDTDRDGKASGDAWELYGFDLDGWSSTPAQGFHCSPQPGGKIKSIRVDGPHGIDNSFGPNVVRDILQTLWPDSSHAENKGIATGFPTLLIDIDALGAASDYLLLTGGFLTVQGADTAPPPVDWSSYAWRPWTTPKDAFGNAYLTGNTLVMIPLKPLLIALDLDQQALPLQLHLARLSLDLSDRTRGVNGQIGGILDTEEFIASLKGLAGNLDPNLCGDSATFEGIAAKIRAASDILTDGTQDPAKMCNGISIGLGFSTRAASKGQAVEAPTFTDPCANL